MSGTRCRTSCVNICDFSLEIFYWIQEYVDINALLLTSSRLTVYRHQLFQWRLSMSCIPKYLTDRRVIEYPHRQVCLRVEGFRDPSFTRIPTCGHVHTLILSQCTSVTDVSSLGHVHTLDLSYCTGVTDVSSLGHVHTLRL